MRRSIRASIRLCLSLAHLFFIEHGNGLIFVIPTIGGTMCRGQAGNTLKDRRAQLMIEQGIQSFMLHMKMRPHMRPGRERACPLRQSGSLQPAEDWRMLPLSGVMNLLPMDN